MNFYPYLVSYFILSYPLGLQCRPNPFRLTIDRRAASMVLSMTTKSHSHDDSHQSFPVSDRSRIEPPMAHCLAANAGDPARSETWRMFLFVHSYNDMNAGGRPRKVEDRLPNRNRCLRFTQERAIQRTAINPQIQKGKPHIVSECRVVKTIGSG